MKDRIEELAQQSVIEDIQYVRPGSAIAIAITTAVNEALELAARKCDALTELFGPRNDFTRGQMRGAENCAAAIRKLKVE